MHPGQRVILNTTDLSNTLDNYRASAVAFAVTAGQYLYIGQEMPFTNLWFEVDSPSTVAARQVAVQVRFAQQWVDAVDLFDGTAVGGAAMAQPGRVSWALRWDRCWDWDIRTEYVAGLEGFELYDLFWARLSWSGSLSNSLTLRYIGQKFCSDAEIYTFYPDLRNQSLKTTFGGSSLKTDWREQSFAASDVIVRDLISKRIIRDRGQIADWRLFVEPAVHKTAEIVYRGLGAAYRDDAQAATKAYSQAMQIESFRIDKAGEGRLTGFDKRTQLTFLRR